MTRERVRVRPYSYADRLLTPLSLSACVITAGALVGYIVDRVTALALAGVSAAPLLQLVATLVAAAGTLGTVLLQVLARVQSGRVEAEAGTAASILREVQADRSARSAAPGGSDQAA